MISTQHLVGTKPDLIGTRETYQTIGLRRHRSGIEGLRPMVRTAISQVTAHASDIRSLLSHRGSNAQTLHDGNLKLNYQHWVIGPMRGQFCWVTMSLQAFQQVS